MFTSATEKKITTDKMADFAPKTTRFFDDVCHEFPILATKMAYYRETLSSLGAEYFTSAEHIISLVENICKKKVGNFKNQIF